MLPTIQHSFQKINRDVRKFYMGVNFEIPAKYPEEKLVEKNNTLSTLDTHEHFKKP